MINSTIDWMVQEWGMTIPLALVLLRSVMVVVTIILSITANRIAKRVGLRIVTRVVRRTCTNWDDILLERAVFERMSHLAPALVIYWMAEVAFVGIDPLILITQRGSQVYMIVVGLMVVDGLLNALHDIYQQFPAARDVPIKGFVQVIKIVVNCLGTVLILSVVIQKSPGIFLGSLGAMTAVTMLVFRDPILGFVAGIQLTANRMVRPGDWIEMPKFGADGDVLEVGLTTVKVQNWDKTITMIPTYSLISDSFKNWRGMQDSGGRRIKRAIQIDMTSVTFCDDAMLERLEKVAVLTDYIARKRMEVAAWNREQGVDESTPVNGRRLTNLGTFRAYLEQYLRNHPQIHKGMTFLVRQLPPTAHGLPIEIYVFSSDQVWANYEAIQADIFDHILAVLPEFGLRVFQAPTGADLDKLAPSQLA